MVTAKSTSSVENTENQGNQPVADFLKNFYIFVDLF